MAKMMHNGTRTSQRTSGLPPEQKFPGSWFCLLQPDRLAPLAQYLWASGELVANLPVARACSKASASEDRIFNTALMTALCNAVWSGAGHGQAIHTGLQPCAHVSTAGLCNLPDGIPMMRPACLSQLILPLCSFCSSQPVVFPAPQSPPDLL